MSLHVSISEFESIAVSNYPNIILQALSDDFEPEMFSLVPSDKGEGVPPLEEARKMILSHIKKTAKKREILSARYTAAIDSAEIILSYLKGGDKKAITGVEATVSEIEQLEKMVEAMPMKTRSDMEERSDIRKRIAKLSASRRILFEGILSPDGGSKVLTETRKKARYNYEKTRSGADRLLFEAASQYLGFKDKDVAGLEALLLKARQTRDVIEMGQWKLLDCVEAAIAEGWDRKDGHAVPQVPFSEVLLSNKKTLQSFFENGAGFALALEGPIGTGKSAITKAIARNTSIEPATYAVPSLNSAFFGVPFHDKETGMVRIVPTEDGARLTTIPSCLVFDELLRVGNMGVDMQNMLLRVLLDNEVSPGRKLHPLTMKIVTTNNPDDTSNPHAMKDWNEALANRMKHYISKVTESMGKEWLEWARDKFLIDDRESTSSSRVHDVLIYLESRFEEGGPKVFHSVPKGKELRNDPAFPTFRTWAAVLGAARISTLTAPEFASKVVAVLVGKEAADDFLRFTTASSILPNLDDLLGAVSDFPYTYLPAAADSVVVQNQSYFDEPDGGLTDGKNETTKKQMKEREQEKQFAIKSLGKNTILQLNGGKHEAEERSVMFSGKPLIDRMTDQANKNHLDKSEREICDIVEKFMNDLWEGVDSFTAGAAAESLLTGALFHHIRKSFERGVPADGKFISDIMKLVSLYPHPEARESMFRTVDRFLISNPDTFILSGLRRYGIDYSPRNDDGQSTLEEKFIKKLAVPDESAEENKMVATSRILGVFPTIATLEFASERWSRGCGRAATKYTVPKKQADGQTVAQEVHGAGVPVGIMQEKDTTDSISIPGNFFQDI